MNKIYDITKDDLNKDLLDFKAGDTVLIPDGDFHQVLNTSKRNDLEFICVFDGGRNH